MTLPEFVARTGPYSGRAIAPPDLHSAVNSVLLELWRGHAPTDAYAPLLYHEKNFIAGGLLFIGLNPPLFAKYGETDVWPRWMAPGVPDLEAALRPFSDTPDYRTLAETLTWTQGRQDGEQLMQSIEVAVKQYAVAHEFHPNFQRLHELSAEISAFAHNYKAEIMPDGFSYLDLFAHWTKSLPPLRRLLQLREGMADVHYDFLKPTAWLADSDDPAHEWALQQIDLVRRAAEVLEPAVVVMNHPLATRLVNHYWRSRDWASQALRASSSPPRYHIASPVQLSASHYDLLLDGNFISYLLDARETQFIPVLYAGTLSGAHGMDVFSYTRLKALVKFVLYNTLVQRPNVRIRDVQVQVAPK